MGAGELQAIGHESTINTDTAGPLARLTAGGTVARDVTAPELRSEIASPLLPSGEMLPWEDLALRMAEGVDPAPLAAGIEVRSVGDAGRSANVGWSFAPSDPTINWSGVLAATGRTRDWEGLAAMTMKVAVAKGGLIDSSSLPMAADYSGAAFRFADIGPAVASHGFDGGSLPSSWGQVTFRSATEPNPLCENGGCAVLGPFQRSLCRMDRLGIAGRLSVPASAGKLELRVRYRVMLAQQVFTGHPFSIDVAVPGQKPVSTEVPRPLVNDSGADAGDLRFVTDFLDVRVPVPDFTATSDATQGVGFAVYGANKNDIACEFVYMNHWVKTQVVIDQVTLEPAP